MKYKIFIISLFICSLVQAQSIFFKEKLADKEFNRYNYYGAIPMYLQINKQKPADIKIMGNLAESYRKINDSENAAVWYRKIIEAGTAKPEDYLYYAQALGRNGDYPLAGEWYQKYYDQNQPNAINGLAFEQAFKNISPFYRDSAYYSIHKTSFNSNKSDFSPMYYRGGIVFVTARKEQGTFIKTLYNWTRTSFLDLYVSDSLKTQPFSSAINTRFHEGPVTFSPAQDTIIFTRSNYYHLRFRTDNQGINKLEMYQAVWNAKKKCWGNVTPMPFNNNHYSVGHPTLSHDGKSLYFISDMPGGLGQTDIYVSHLEFNTKTRQNEWGKPENLGEDINTPGKEMFPYVDANGNLYFATNGRPGLGGLDIFVAKRNKDGGFDKPVNLGYPVNTRFDDFGLICDASGKHGYLSSDRNNAIGDDDIYQWNRSPRPLVLFVYDKATKQALPATHIGFSYGNLTDSLKSDRAGYNSLFIKSADPYKFKLSKKNYNDATFDYTAESLTNTDTIGLPLELTKVLPKIALEGKVFSAEDKQPMGNATAILINKADSSRTEVKCDQNGVFRFKLDADADYSVKVVINTPGSKCGSNAVERTTRGIANDYTFNESFPVFCVGDIIKIDNIYYDLGKYNIRPDAAKELDKLLDIMNKYPKMKIELRSHTDSRGSDESNMKLSDNRAKAAAAYLVSKGIAADRIIGKGYGETMLLNNCGNGVKCTEAQHQINRRTEFKILSIE
ncbi:MAG: OmpA family protein [Bacteroidota bacterium]|nr:OmpA family protein [Bacteroidota bacterium]